MQYSRRYKRATLIENANRIKTAAQSASAAIVEMGGVAPETIDAMADAIRNIPSSKVAIGTFTTATSGFSVDCGFKPKWVVVSSAFNGTTSSAVFTNTETEIWNDDGGYFEYYTAASATNGSRTTNRIGVNNNGFTHNARYNAKPAYYIAIG